MRDQDVEREQVRNLANRMLAIARAEGGWGRLKRLERFVTRVESYAQSAKHGLVVECQPCFTLKCWRLRLGLTQPELSLLANVYSILAENGYTYAEIVAHLHRLKDCRSRLDTTHISKFERGTQPPWDRAQVLLSEVISILADEPIERALLFPEDTSKTKTGDRRANNNRRFTRAAIENAQGEVAGHQL